jgi:ABC-type Fe3+/spermidine/putrescine transport system ATPase subunit
MTAALRQPPDASSTLSPRMDAERHHFDPVPPALTIDHVCAEIGGGRVVDGVTIGVAAGEMIAVVGPSGCGKSTLLRTICGLHPAAHGRVLVGGRDVTALPPERRSIGLVFQDHALFPHLRIAQNVAFGLQGLARTARSQRVAEVLDIMKLGHTARRYPHELSGGEQQRIALARALAPRPPVVLLDEPFASIDTALRDELRADVVAALREHNTAAVFVTHDREDALGVGHRVGVMRNGRIEQLASASDVFERPANPFVARFLGDANLIADADGALRLARPHQVTLRHGGNATVTSRRYTGRGWRYSVTWGDQSVVADSALNLQPGEACTVCIDELGTLHRFGSS